MAAVHVIGAGTDAGSLWLQVPIALTMALALTLLGHRLLGDRPVRGGAPAPRRPRLPAPATAGAGAPAPTQPMPVVPRPVAAAAADDEAPTTPGYRSLWARAPAGPPRD
jgi:hypothetical protein